MGQMVGSDPDQLDSLGDLLTKASDRLNAIGGEVNSLLTYTGWEGGDAEDFRWQWHHQLTGILHATAVQSQEAARVLQVNAAEQRSASADHGGGFPGLTPSPAWTSGTPGSDAAPWWDPVLDFAGVTLGAFSGVGLLNKAFEAAEKLPNYLEPFARFTGKAADLVPGPVLLALSGVVDGVKFFGGDPGDPDTVNAGVDLGLDVIEAGLLIGTAFCPPLAVALVTTEAVHFGFDVITAIDPTLPTRVADGMSDFVAGAVEDTADAIGDASEAVGGVISGGVDAVGKFLGF
jgi:hypothetical protein